VPRRSEATFPPPRLFGMADSSSDLRNKRLRARTMKDTVTPVWGLIGRRASPKEGFPSSNPATRQIMVFPHQTTGASVKRVVPLLVVPLLILVVGACAVAPQPTEAPSPAEIPTLEAQRSERPTDPGLLLRLGAAYREAGRLEDARVALEQARERAPEDPGVLFYLGVTYEELEAWGDARGTYEAFLALDTPDPALRSRIEDRLPRVRRAQLLADARQSLAMEEELAGTEPQAGTVAVFPFRYEGANPEFESLGRALAELTVTDLGRIGRLTVLERLRVQLLLDEMALAEEGLVDQGTAARSGRLLGAGRIVQGSVADDADRIDVLAAVVESATGQPGEPVSEDDELERLYDLQRRMVLALHTSMGIQLTEAEREMILERPTRSLRALLLLGQALEAEDRGAYEEAEELFEQALEEEPGFEEAEDGRDRSRAAIDSEGVGPSELAFEGTPQIPPPSGPALDPRLEFRDVEALIPAPEGRDASAELLDTEGLRTSPALLEIILRPPGGGE